MEGKRPPPPFPVTGEIGELGSEANAGNRPLKMPFRADGPKLGRAGKWGTTPFPSMASGEIGPTPLAAKWPSCFCIRCCSNAVRVRALQGWKETGILNN